MAKSVRKITLKDKKIFKNAVYKKDRSYPDSSISTEHKKKEYFMRWAEKIYSLFLSRQTWMNSGSYDKIDEYRAWADGNQDVSEMLDWILGKSEAPEEVEGIGPSGWDIRGEVDGSGKREAWSNLDTNPVSIFPKIKTKINEQIRSMYYEMSVDAIDSYSLKEVESRKYQLWFYKQNKKWMDTQLAMAGVKRPQDEFVPENFEELELYASTGGIKMPYSITMEDLIKHTFLVSGWDKDVGEKVRGDLMTISHSIIKEEFDRELKRVVVRYCDPKYSGLQYGKSGYKDSEFGYEIRWVEVSKIRQRLNMTYEEAASLAYSYSGMYGNPKSSQWNKYDDIYSDDSGNEWLSCDFYKIPVFEFEFNDLDTEDYLEFENKHGYKRTKPYKGEIQDNEKLKKHEYRLVREGKWIVGTHHVYDYGTKEYIPRDEFNKPRISFRGVKLNTESLLKQVLPFMKGFQLAWIKLQNAIAMAVGNGFAIDIGAIKGIAIGAGQNWDPMEVLKFYRQSTFLMYKQKRSLSGLSRSSAPPIIPLQNASYDNVKTQFEAMNFFMQKIEDAGGISMISTGKAPDPDTAKFNMQVSLQGTNDIINNIARGQTDLQEDISVNICYRIRSYCRVNKSVLDSYEQVVGKNRMVAVMMAEKNHVSYGISIEAADITEEKRNIMMMIQQAITPTGSGDGAKLSAAEGILILDMIHQRQNIRRIGQVLGHMIRRKERENYKQRLELINVQGNKNNELKMIEARQKDEEQIATARENHRKFQYDFMIKHGKHPNQVMNNQNN